VIGILTVFIIECVIIKMSFKLKALLYLSVYLVRFLSLKTKLFTVYTVNVSWKARHMMDRDHNTQFS